MKNYEQKSGRKSFNHQEMKEQKKPDKKIKDQLTKIQNNNIPISLEHSNDKKNIQPKKKAIKSNQKSEHKKFQSSSDVKNNNINLNNNLKIEEENKKNEEIQKETEEPQLSDSQEIC